MTTNKVYTRLSINSPTNKLSHIKNRSSQHVEYVLLKPFDFSGTKSSVFFYQNKTSCVVYIGITLVIVKLQCIHSLISKVIEQNTHNLLAII